MQPKHKANESKTDNTGRGKPSKGRPWCWQEKDALTMITDTFSESDQAASACSVYVALTELASDNGTETFTAKKALIAHKAGVSVSTVARLLKGFEQLGVVKIGRGLVPAVSGAIKSPNTYTLLPMRNNDVSIGHDDASSIGHELRRPLNPDKVKEREKKPERKLKETPYPPQAGGGFGFAVFGMEQSL
jgi:hypothetical protein